MSQAEGEGPRSLVQGTVPVRQSQSQHQQHIAQSYRSHRHATQDALLERLFNSSLDYVRLFHVSRPAQPEDSESTEILRVERAYAQLLKDLGHSKKQGAEERREQERAVREAAARFYQQWRDHLDAQHHAHLERVRRAFRSQLADRLSPLAQQAQAEQASRLQQLRQAHALEVQEQEREAARLKTQIFYCHERRARLERRAQGLREAFDYSPTRIQESDIPLEVVGDQRMRADAVVPRYRKELQNLQQEWTAAQAALERAQTAQTTAGQIALAKAARLEQLAKLTGPTPKAAPVPPKTANDILGATPSTKEPAALSRPVATFPDAEAASPAAREAALHLKYTQRMEELQLRHDREVEELRQQQRKQDDKYQELHDNLLALQQDPEVERKLQESKGLLLRTTAHLFPVHAVGARHKGTQCDEVHDFAGQ